MADEERGNAPGGDEAARMGGESAGGESDHLVEPENPLPSITIDDLPSKLQEAARKAGWPSLMPVQARAIPYMLEGKRDMMVQSRTGSGKTGAFILPILSRINPAVPHCQALVLVPTRELAVQVAKEATTLAGDSGLNVVVVYGGVAYGPQLEGFKKGAHLVVGTPGRILDHLMKRSLDFEDLHTLVFDEADRMMSMGFYPDMVQLRKYLPRKRSGYMFSATFPPNVLGLAREFLHEPEFLSLSRDNVHVTDIDHVYYEVPPMDKDRILVRLIEIENPTSALIFCNTKDRVNYVATVLQRFGYDADQITADLAQKSRERVLEQVRTGSLRFLVATDLAGRGIDIPNLSHVFIYEFPEDQESYIHRAGRTGRAGATGTAISLVGMTDVGDLERTAKRYGIKMEKRPIPTPEDVEAVVGERVTALLENKLRNRDRLKLERMNRFLGLARTLAESEDELPIIAMLMDDYYQESLHARAVSETPAPAPAPKPPPPPTTGDSSSGGASRRRGRPGKR